MHELVDKVEYGHPQRDPVLLLGPHADEQGVEAVGLPILLVPVIPKHERKTKLFL